MRATSEWHEWLPYEDAFRRAGARRRYNAQRRFAADLRLHAIVDWADANGIAATARGFQSRLAERFGVSRSTISRDLAKLRERRAADYACPECGTDQTVRTRLR